MRTPKNPYLIRLSLNEKDWVYKRFPTKEAAEIFLKSGYCSSETTSQRYYLHIHGSSYVKVWENGKCQGEMLNESGHRRMAARIF